MAKVNPQDEKYDGGGGRTEQCGPGTKLFAVVGYERYSSSRGNPVLSIRLLCLLDREGSKDEGKVVFENFTLTDKAMWRLVNFARAIGYNEPFDTDDNEAIGALLTSGYVDGLVHMDRWGDKETPKVKEFSAPAGYTEDPDWGAMIDQGEADHRDYLKWRADNPRGAGGSSGGGGSRRGGGGSGGGRRDNIPF